MKHVLEIPQWVPHRLNQLLGHWAQAARRKKQDREFIGIYAHLQRIPKAEGKRRVSLVITLGPKMRSPDKDCWWKSVADALSACGLVKDDSPKWIEFGAVVYERGPQRATRIELEDL